jgi:pimeloyl-ACP methyl ester carboxylesterase
MSNLQHHEKQRLMRFKAADGFPITGLLVTNEYTRKEEILHIPVLLQIHGLLGHFLARGTPRLLPHAMLAHGFNSLSINTRLAAAGQMTSQGIFDDTINDIDAAIELLVQEGFQSIYILGYSLGAAMVVHWAANREHPLVKGLILEGAGFSLPDSRRKRWDKWGSSPTYAEVYERAKTILGADPYRASDDEVFVAYQASGPSREPIHSEIYTYKTWWFMIGPEAYGAMTHRHIEQVNVPMLLLRGEHDPLVEEWETRALAQIVQEAGRAEVQVSQIPGAGHDCMENSEEMLRAIVQMMSAESPRSDGHKKQKRNGRRLKQRTGMNEERPDGDE